MNLIVAIFFAVVFGVFAFNAFIENHLTSAPNGNKIINMLLDIYNWFVEQIGYIPTGVIFALCALVILALGINEARKKRA